MKERNIACNCVKCTTARLKDLGAPSMRTTFNEKENLLNKICDEIEAECSHGIDGYDRERMKKRLLRHIIS